MLRFTQFREILSEELKKISGKLGSNAGGVYHDTETNKKHYIKFYDNPDQAKSEVLSSKIHEYMGGHSMSPEYVNHEGKHGVKTDWNDHLKTINPKTPLSTKHKKQIAKLYHASVLTKNWDLVGQEHDNLAINHKTGNVHIVDTGGSFNFRAMGGHKPYDSDIKEYHSLRDPEKNPESHSLLKHAFGDGNSVPKSAHKPFTPEDHKHIHNLFSNSGVKNWKELHKNFVERSNKLNDHYQE